MQIFYTPDIDSEYYVLSEEESKHCIRVLRMNIGSVVQLVDGRGGLYEAEITEPNPKRTRLRILKHIPEYGKQQHRIHMAVAPTKNIDRLEWFLEKATEIGIDEISPIICERSERKEIKTERLRKVITSAVKQSLKAYHPILNEARNFSSFLENAHAQQRFIAHCIDEGKSEIKDLLIPNSEYLVLIGPEGDFSPTEIKSALEKGFQPITLGEARLRTETAALSACFELNFLNR